jgi:hypothetical protein
MIRALVTVIVGAIFAIATMAIVALYWAMIAIFGMLHVLTFPLQALWRGIRGT